VSNLREENLQKRLEVVRSSLSGKVSNKESAKKLGCGLSTFKRYNEKLTAKQKEKIRSYKIKGPWRSARKVRDDLKLSVHAQTVWRVLSNVNLMHSNPERFWRFVQRDFVRENFKVKDIQELNQKWNK